MEILQQWLGDWIDLSGISDSKLDEELTRIGHAVEGVYGQGEDRVLDLEITTNRVDAMSHRGLARELVPVLGKSLNEVAPLVDVDGLEPVDIEIEPGSGCARFAGLLIRGVSVGQSPEWLAGRLESLGHRSVNNIVDLTNYVMLDLGHPLHAFDYDKLADERIVVRRGVAGEKIETLDGEIRIIDPDTIVVADGSGPVALGGVMGGASTEISSGTRNVLLECAWFDPATIRLTARRLNLKTDASYRFERGADPNDIPETIRKCAALVVEAAGGSVEAYSDVVSVPQERLELTLRGDKLAELSVGTAPLDTAREILEGLQMDLIEEADQLLVRVPTWRRDITQEIDLLEEVLRLNGYEKIPASLPRLSTGDVRREQERGLEEAIRDRASSYGLSEVVTYSFQSRELLARFSDEEPLIVSNALSESVEAMRTSMLPGLVDIAASNFSQGNRDGGVFEVGRTYHSNGDEILERPRLGIVLWGARPSHWNEAAHAVDFFDGRGIVDALAQSAGKRVAWESSEEMWGDAGFSARGFIDSKLLASVAVLSNRVRDQFGLKGPVVCVEVRIGLLHRERPIEFAEVSKFPGIPMVLALRHDSSVKWTDIESVVNQKEEDLLADLGLWDQYAPEESDQIKTTIAMWFQSNERSLNQEEVQRIHESIATRLEKSLKVEVVKERDQ